MSNSDKPSQETRKFWIWAERQTGSYPEPKSRSGKWLVFVDVEEVDEVWAKIRRATEDGRLGKESKVSAGPEKGGIPTRRVICVYTYDWADEQDVRRIRNELRVLGIVSKIPYKTDADTLARRYGDDWTPKYFE